MKLKTALIIVLFVFMIGAYAVTSEFSIAVDSDKPLNIISFLTSLGKTVVAFGDPCGGGPGSGD